MKKLTITVSEEVYAGLHARIGQGRIGRFLESLARPHAVDEELDAAYRTMALDEAKEADWADNLMGKVADEAR